MLTRGFIAQEVEKAAQQSGYDFDGIKKPQNDRDNYGLTYATFVVPLVKAVQELSNLGDTKDSIIQLQTNRINDLEKRLEKLESMVSGSAANIQLSSSSLQQNVPNPFKNITSIDYLLNRQFTSAKIIVTDKKGKTISTINVSDSRGNIKLDASTLSSGTYEYTLYVNGRMIDRKQMVVVK